VSRLCVRVEEIIPVDQICMGFRGCFNDFGDDIAEIAGEAVTRRGSRGLLGGEKIEGDRMYFHC